MNAERLIPAVVGEGLPLPLEARYAMVARMHDLVQRFLLIAATNRLQRSDYAGSAYVEHVNDLVQWELTTQGIRMSAPFDTPPSERDARAIVHWLEVGWALCWTQHPHVMELARPVAPLDVTVTLDPVAAVTSAITHPFVEVGKELLCVPREGDPVPAPTGLDERGRAAIENLRARGVCACRLCTWARPRIEKWAKKRAGLPELYRRIGQGESVLAKDILPLVGADRLMAAEEKPPKKSAELSAEEAKRWLALNPNRAF
ncbi:MAG: hypothetical protein KC619_27075 [Myxococcales bacterium]|nr:hypothetical protein [Myxococcales bacterium]